MPDLPEPGCGSVVRINLDVPARFAEPHAFRALPEEAAARLEYQGWAVLPGFFSARECAALRMQFDEDGAFRSTVDMRRHGFGSGRYRYFRYPLPKLVEERRAELYRALVPIANRWQAARSQAGFPSEHAEYLRTCRAAGQARPTPLLLRYRTGDFNRLHQDLYGDEVFPLQAVTLLSQPGEDFAGGELVLVEQKPRSQSRTIVVPLERGDTVVFAVDRFPVAGPRGHHQRHLRHGVSELWSGERFTLGLIFHDAL